MKLINRKNLEDLLLQNWTKFIDIKSISDLLINNIQLYASNWSVLVPTRSYATKKIHISKTEFTPEKDLIFWFSFEISKNDKFYVGTFEIICAIDGAFKINNTSGIIYQTTDN